jgi:hypothetical protein
MDLSVFRKFSKFKIEKWKFSEQKFFLNSISKIQNSYTPSLDALLVAPIQATCLATHYSALP